MIAIWRRMRKGVREIGDTEWALLGFEILGVVGGVFLAFQLGSWVEDRREARAQDELMHRLFDEAQVATTRIFEQRDEFAELRDAQEDALVAWLAQGRCPTPDGWTALSSLSFYPALNPPSTAYDEMVGSGGLSRIANPVAREAVAGYHSDLAEYSRQIDYFRMWATAQSYEYDTGGTATIDPETGEMGSAGDDMSGACASRENKNDLASKFRNSRKIQVWREELAEKARIMCVTLGREVGRECDVPESE